MELKDAVKGRRTVRKFLDKPVPVEIISEIASEALWSPSWGNTQPWELVVVTGAALDRFKAANREALLSGKQTTHDIPMPDAWPDQMKERYKTVGKQVLGAQSIARDDAEGRMNYYGEMFSLFDPPALLLILLDKSLLLEYAMLDVGLYLQTFMLLAHDRGLGTAALAASVHFPEVVRSHLPIPENKWLAIGAAVGYADPDDPVNRFERTRSPLEEFISWVE
jgi:nitroreductase